jgi:hypothetical protein
MKENFVDSDIVEVKLLIGLISDRYEDSPNFCGLCRASSLKFTIELFILSLFEMIEF